MVHRTIEVCGHKVNVINFGYATYLYPAFNGNAEFKATKHGYKNLSGYLRFINWMKANRQEIIQAIQEIKAEC